MESSILNSTKEILGLQADYTPFDLSVITHINSAFSILKQLGVPLAITTIEDDSAEWDDLDILQDQLNMVRTYIFLKVRMLFDIPATSFVIDALQKQIDEHEWRLMQAAESDLPLPVIQPVRPVPLTLQEEPTW